MILDLFDFLLADDSLIVSGLVSGERELLLWVLFVAGVAVQLAIKGFCDIFLEIDQARQIGIHLLQIFLLELFVLVDIILIIFLILLLNFKRGQFI